MNCSNPHDLLCNIAQNSPDFPRWSLKGKVCLAVALSVYDGDTFDALMIIKDEVARFRIRLLGYNSPEIKTSTTLDKDEKSRIKRAAFEARDKLSDLLGAEILPKHLLEIHCCDFDVFGRVLGRVNVLDNHLDKNILYCVNDKMMLLESCVPFHNPHL